MNTNYCQDENCEYWWSEYETCDLRIALLKMAYDHAILFELLIFMSWRQIPCLRQKSIDRRKIHLIIGKPAYWASLLLIYNLLGIL